MALDYAKNPSLGQKWRRLFQNWRLMSFIGVCVLVFGYFGYAIIGEMVTSGIHKQGDYAVVNLKALGQYVFDSSSGQDTDIPIQYRALDGKKVKLEGFMYTPNSAGGSTSSCQLVWNVQRCCFSGPPQVQERVFLRTPKDRRMNRYDSNTLVTVTGTLYVKVQKDTEGSIYSVYDLVLDNVAPNI